MEIWACGGLESVAIHSYRTPVSCGIRSPGPQTNLPDPDGVYCLWLHGVLQEDQEGQICWCHSVRTQPWIKRDNEITVLSHVSHAEYFLLLTYSGHCPSFSYRTCHLTPYAFRIKSCSSLGTLTTWHEFSLNHLACEPRVWNSLRSWNSCQRTPNNLRGSSTLELKRAQQLDLPREPGPAEVNPILQFYCLYKQYMLHLALLQRGA